MLSEWPGNLRRLQPDSNTKVITDNNDWPPVAAAAGAGSIPNSIPPNTRR